MISPIGHTVEDSWKAALAGESGIKLNESFDTSDFAVKIAGSVRDFDISPYMNPKEARRIDDFIQLGIAAASQAIQDAGLESHPSDADRIGVVIGSGIGGINTIESTSQHTAKKRAKTGVSLLRARRRHQHDFGQCLY